MPDSRFGRAAFTTSIWDLLSWLLVALLLGGVASDLASTWLHYHESSYWRISLGYRGVIGLLLSGVVLSLFGKWPNYMRWLFAAAMVSVVLLWLRFTISPDSEAQDYFESTIDIYKICYPMILFVAVKAIMWGRPRLFVRLCLCLDITISAYLIFIFLGFISHSDMFRTYWDGLRPGYRGIILSQNEATGVLLIAVFWFAIRYFSGQRSALLLGASVIACLLLGTKGVILASVPLLAGLFWVRYGAIKMMPLVLWLSMVIAALAVVEYRYSESVQSAVALFQGYMSSQLAGNTWGDMASLLLSGRDVRIDGFLPTLSGDLSPYFLLGGTPISYGLMEVDPIDAFLRAGLIFLMLVLISYWRMFRFAGGSRGLSYRLVLFIVWMGVAFTGGHMWMASTAAPMLMIALTYTSAVPSHRDFVRHRRGSQMRLAESG